MAKTQTITTPKEDISGGAGFYVGGVQTSVPQTTSTPTPSSDTTVSAPEATPKSLGLTYSPDPTQTTIDQATKSLIDSYGTKAPSASAVRSSVVSQFQGEIDALDRAKAEAQASITKNYAQTEKENTGVDAAIQARRGLLGSDFGAAQTSRVVGEVRGARDQKINDSNTNFDTAKSALLTQARTMANDEYNRKLEAYRAGTGATIQYLKDKQVSSQANALKLVKQAYLSDVDITDPGYALDLRSLAQQVGVTPETFKQLYLDYKSEQDAARAEATRKQLLEDRQYGLDVGKYNLDVSKAQFDVDKFNQEYALNKAKTEAEISKINNDIANGGANQLIDPDFAAKYGLPLGLTKGQVAGFIPGQDQNFQEVETKLDATKNVQRLLNELINHPGRKAATGTNRLLTAIPGSDARDFVAKFDELKAILALDNISKLKGTGAISDREGELLANAASSLRRDTSEGAFNTELQRLLDTANTRIDKLQNFSNSYQSNSLFNEFEQGGGSEGTNPKVQSTTQAPISLRSVNTQKLASAVLPTFPQGKNLGDTQGQCVTFLHKIADFPPIGDGKNAKIASLEKFISQGKGLPASKLQGNAQVGMIIVSGDNKTYGHVAMINAISSDGKYARVTESNYAKPGTVTHTRVVALNDPRLYGAFIPNGFKNIA